VRDEVWGGELGRGELGRDERGFGLAQTESDGGVANAGALLGETFEQFLIEVREGGGRGRKNFEDSSELRVVVGVEDGNDEDGPDAEVGDGGVDAWVELGVDGKLGLSALKTCAGKTVVGVEGHAKIWGEVSGGGAADHFISAGEGQSGGAGAGGSGGADYEFVED